MKKYYYVFIVFFSFIALTSCNKNDFIEGIPNQENGEIGNKVKNENDSPTNFDLIQENLNEFHNTIEFQNRANLLYYCSEELGTYTSYPYLHQGYYLNALYAPPQGPNLQDLLNNRFRDPNASGNHAVSININFEIYTGGTYLDTIEANRVYNEIICQINTLINNHIRNIQSNNQSKPARSREYNIDFLVDYQLCCVGSSCCYPIVSAAGVAYY